MALEDSYYFFATRAGVVADRGPSYAFVGSAGLIANGSSVGLPYGVHRTDVAVSDLNGDGETDFFLANRQTADGEPAPDVVLLQDRRSPNWNEFDWWRSGLSDAVPRELTAYYSESVELGDLNNDGAIDAVTAGLAPEIAHIWFNDGEGNFIESEQRLPVSGEHVAIGDLNNDGFIDLFALTNEANQVWLNDGNGAFADSGQRLGGSPSSHIALGDMDADGDLDAFVTNRSGHASRLWLNDGSGVFADSGTRLGPQLESERVALGDIDFDGDLDVVVANSGASNHVYLNAFREADLTPPRFVSIGYEQNDEEVAISLRFSKPVTLGSLSFQEQQIPRRDLTWNEHRTVFHWTMPLREFGYATLSIEAQDGLGQALVDLPARVFTELAGDFDRDLRVTEEDFWILAANFGQRASVDEGDINGNGVVDFEDFLFLASNYA